MGEFTVILFVVAFCCLRLGKWLADKRWEANADIIQRIESGGRLYKVIHDKDYQP